MPPEPALPALLHVDSGRSTAWRGAHTLRTGEGPYGDFNLAFHVGDDANRVGINRAALQRQLGLRHIEFIDQVHGTAVHEARHGTSHATATADAVWTRERNLGCAVLTADCVPVLLAERSGASVGVAHCGWRGLAQGVLRALVAALPAPADALVAHIGPGIGAARYSVGRDVVDAFTASDDASEDCFRPAQEHGKFHADLEGLARHQLRALGVREIVGGGFCTARDPRWYSYRRLAITGRFASIVWRT